jgi:hypothetical protein
MKGLIYLTIVFISILLVTILIKHQTQEPFVIFKDDIVLSAIDDVKNAFTNVGIAAEAKNKKTIKTPTETKPVSYVVKKNKSNLDTLAATYESMDEYDIDPISSINSIQANLNEYIEIYNYINGKLRLDLQALKTNMIVLPTAQSSQQEFNQKLFLSPTALSKQLETQLAKKVPSIISAKLPVQSALHPPPELIKIYKAPPEKPQTLAPKPNEPPIFDIYDQLKKVYSL